MNILEAVRVERKLTYEALGLLVGHERHVAWSHCKKALVPAEAAIKYSQALGIPLPALRPDLYPPPGDARR